MTRGELAWRTWGLHAHGRPPKLTWEELPTRQREAWEQVADVIAEQATVELVEDVPEPKPRPVGGVWGESTEARRSEWDHGDACQCAACTTG